MKENYYLVKTMCGHVGRNCYIPIVFAIRAESGKEAAKIARSFPRVKHDNKFAILGVKKVSFEEYVAQADFNNNDDYLNWRSRRFEDDYDQNSVIDRVVHMEGNPYFAKEPKKKHDKKRTPRREEMYYKKLISDYMFALEA